jgi:hypothetical protein
MGYTLDQEYTKEYCEKFPDYCKPVEIGQRRLALCEMELKKMSKSLKTQDSICSALVTEITIYKQLGKI